MPRERTLVVTSTRVLPERKSSMARSRSSGAISAKKIRFGREGLRRTSVERGDRVLVRRHVVADLDGSGVLGNEDDGLTDGEVVVDLVQDLELRVLSTAVNVELGQLVKGQLLGRNVDLNRVRWRRWKKQQEWRPWSWGRARSCRRRRRWRRNRWRRRGRTERCEGRSGEP